MFPALHPVKEVSAGIKTAHVPRIPLSKTNQGREKGDEALFHNYRLVFDVTPYPHRRGTCVDNQL